MKLHRPITYCRMIKRSIIPYNPNVEQEVKNVMFNIRGKLFVDVGANTGQYSIPMSKHFDKVIAFEPNRQYSMYLRANEKKNVTCLDYAISNRDGFTKYYINMDDKKSSGSADTIVANTVLQEWNYNPRSNPNFKKTFKYDNGIEVETKRLDSLFNEDIDLVKIDVEGAEFLVLNGASKLLKEHKIKRIIVELHNKEMEDELMNLFSGYEYYGKWIDLDHYYAWCIQ